MVDAIRQIGVSEVTFYRWRKEYGGMKADQVKRLKDLAVGDCGRIAGFGEGGRAYRKKLLSMGLTPGVVFYVTRYAPMGDPVEIRVRGFNLSLRKDEAETLLVEEHTVDD